MSQPTLPLVDHTPHCVDRRRYGDGQCECGAASTPPDSGHLPTCPESRGMDGVSVCTCAEWVGVRGSVLRELTTAVRAALDASALPEYPMAPAIRDRLLRALEALRP